MESKHADQVLRGLRHELPDLHAKTRSKLLFSTGLPEGASQKVVAGKRNGDSDYAENQARSQQAWKRARFRLVRKLRTAHPDYAEQNQKMQHARKA